eukprot:TRINITY_DN65595_c0_g1_i1.p1 TRINITY_DN65595_c0_g1~~TRINITY_DN65595_c0_g1_i1.p1  ORF type:complete len:300 (-),score=30.31 TRINITY_DN65595_c0_g1_i1:227-1057(-)
MSLANAAGVELVNERERVEKHRANGDAREVRRITEQHFPERSIDSSIHEREHGQEVSKCPAQRSHIRFSVGYRQRINSTEEAYFIRKRLKNASRECQQHLACRGQDAHVLVGMFDFTEDAVPTEFTFDGNRHSSIACLPRGVLRMMISLRDHSLITWADYHVAVPSENIMWECTEARNVRLRLTVTSANPGLPLSFRDTTLVLDGCWRISARGVWKNIDLKCNSDGHPMQPVLCVLTLLDGQAPHPTVALPNAMSLEFTRGKSCSRSERFRWPLDM